MGKSKAKRARESRHTNPASIPGLVGQGLGPGGRGSLENYANRVARTPSDLVLAIGDTVEARDKLRLEMDALVRAARVQGVTWERIALAAGLSREGAVTRWGRVRA